MFELNQHEFTRITEAYATGVFRDTFTNTADLHIKVVQGLRELDSNPSPLEFKRLTHSPPLNWIVGNDESGPYNSSKDSLLELHTLPVDHPGYSAREMERFIDSLTNRVRGTERIRNDAALDLSRGANYVAVTISSGNQRRLDWSSSQAGEIKEVRLYKTGQISIRATLPRDGMGAILDREELPKQIAEMLRLTGALGIIQQGHITVAVGAPSDGVSIDTFDPRRSRNQMRILNFGRSADALRTEPDESVSLAALDIGADEVASALSRLLLAQLPT
jgi:hypothetical protein